MRKAFLFLLALLSTFGQSVFAGETAYDAQVHKEVEEIKMPPDEFACKVPDDCDLVSVPCGTSIAVRHDRVGNEQRAIRMSGPQDGCDGAVFDNSSAVCEHGQCTTVSVDRRKETKMPPEWFACKASSDCSLVPFTCSTLAVRTDHKDAAQDAILKKFGHYGANHDPMENCDHYLPVCDKGQCAIQRDGYTGPGFQLNLVDVVCVDGPCTIKSEKIRKAANIAEMPPEWLACKARTDCKLIRFSCASPSIAVSVQYKEAAQAVIDKKFGPFQGCSSSLGNDDWAACDFGQCETVTKNYIHGKGQ